MANIKLVGTRAKLAPRREPYWERLAAGCYLGYRTMAAGKPGTWIARFRNEATGERPTRSLGDYGEFPDSERFDRARADAEVWFAHLGKGGAARTYTVRDACAAYVEHQRIEKGEQTARDCQLRLDQLVLCDEKLAALPLEKLVPGHLTQWRGKVQEGDRSAATVNRNMTALKATLNHAYKSGWVTSDHAWKHALAPMRTDGNRREIYLTSDQRKALVAHCSPDLAALVRCLSILPLRPGAAAALTAGDLDTRHGTLRVGKDKAAMGRTIALPSSVLAFLQEHARDKLPKAPLFTRADGRPWDKDMWKYPLKDAARRADLPEGTVLYSLRHSTITDLIAGGLDPLTVARLSGTSLMMIQKHYGHLTESTARAALERLAS